MGEDDRIDCMEQIEVAKAYLQQISSYVNDRYPVTELCVSHAGLVIENRRLMRLLKMLRLEV
jgi:hypothetical protein